MREGREERGREGDMKGEERDIERERGERGLIHRKLLKKKLIVPIKYCRYYLTFTIC